MYEYTDKVIKYIDKQLIERFSKMRSLISLDEMNVLQLVNETFSEVNEIVRKQYLRLAKDAFRKEARYNSDIIDDYWLDVVLDEYDPVTKYVYSNEYDRRRARLYEALMSSNTKTKEIGSALKSLSLMLRQYAIKITDKATLLALLENNVKFVKWNAESDSRTCGICSKRDGKIYEITDVPAKPHLNCRCWVEKVKLTTDKRITIK